jgi:hypothetical protein
MEAYKIGVVIALQNQVSNVLGLIARDFIKTDKEAKKLQGTLKEIKLLGMTGAVLGGAGFLVSGDQGGRQTRHRIRSPTPVGESRRDEPVGDRPGHRLGVENDLGGHDDDGSGQHGRNPRTPHGVRRHQDAVSNMATVQRLQSVLQNVRGGDAHDEAYTVAKALEMKGAVRNPGQFTTAADLMTKAMIASGGKVAAQDFLSAFKYGRSATIGWDDRFTFGILPTLIQEMKSSGGSGGSGGPGNALMSAYSAVVGGTIPQKSLKVWESLGLLDPSKVIWDKVGSAKGVGPGGVIGSSTFQQDPYQWTQQFLVPALVKAGYDTQDKQRQALQYLFPNRTAGFVMSQMALQGWKFERDQKLIGQASGLSAYDQMIKHDPQMAYAALGAQWENFKTALGVTLVPILIPFLRNLTSALNAVAGFAERHPTLTQGLMTTFAALSLLATLGGGLMVVGAAFKLIGVAFGPLTAVAPLATSAIVGLTAALWPLAVAAGAALGIYETYKHSGDIYDAAEGVGEKFGLWMRKQLGLGPVPTASYVPPPGGNKTTVVVPVNLDGRQIAKVVSGYQYDAWGKAPSSGSAFDGRQSFVPAVSP